MISPLNKNCVRLLSSLFSLLKKSLFLKKMIKCPMFNDLSRYAHPVSTVTDWTRGSPRVVSTAEIRSHYLLNMRAETLPLSYLVLGKKRTELQVSPAVVVCNITNNWLATHVFFNHLAWLKKKQEIRTKGLVDKMLLYASCLRVAIS